MGRKSDAHDPGKAIAYNGRKPLAARITAQAHKDLAALAHCWDCSKQDAIALAFSLMLKSELARVREERRQAAYLEAAADESYAAGVES